MRIKSFVLFLIMTNLHLATNICIKATGRYEKLVKPKTVTNTSQTETTIYTGVFHFTNIIAYKDKSGKEKGTNDLGPFYYIATDYDEDYFYERGNISDLKIVMKNIKYYYDAIAKFEKQLSKLSDNNEISGDALKYFHSMITTFNKLFSYCHRFKKNNDLCDEHLSKLRQIFTENKENIVSKADIQTYIENTKKQLDLLMKRGIIPSNFDTAIDKIYGEDSSYVKDYSVSQVKVAIPIIQDKEDITKEEENNLTLWPQIMTTDKINLYQFFDWNSLNESARDSEEYANTLNESNIYEQTCCFKLKNVEIPGDTAGLRIVVYISEDPYSYFFNISIQMPKDRIIEDYS